MLRVLAFTGGHNNPSGVHRIGRYASLLRGLDVDLVEVSSKSGKYPPERKVLRPAWGLRNLSEHLRGVLLSRRFDATLFQREMLSTFVTLEPFTKRPRIWMSMTRYGHTTEEATPSVWPLFAIM